MKTPFVTNPPHFYGLPNHDKMRVIPHPADKVAPTEEHKRSITENMQKEFAKAAGLPPAPIATQDLYFEPGTEPKPTYEFLSKCYQAFTKIVLDQEYLGRNEFLMPNGMIVAETESWRKGKARVYRIFQNDDDDQGIYSTSDLDELVVQLWELGALS